MSQNEDKPFTFDFGDGVELTADELPDGPQQRMGEHIAEFFGGMGITGITWADPEDEDDADA